MQPIDHRSEGYDQRMPRITSGALYGRVVTIEACGPFSYVALPKSITVAKAAKCEGFGKRSISRGTGYSTVIGWRTGWCSQWPLKINGF